MLVHSPRSWPDLPCSVPSGVRTSKLSPLPLLPPGRERRRGIVRFRRRSLSATQSPCAGAPLDDVSVLLPRGDSQRFRGQDDKWDAYLESKAKLTKQEAWGVELFEDLDRGNCAACHPSQPSVDDNGNGIPPLFRNFSYDNVGIPKSSDLQICRSRATPPTLVKENVQVKTGETRVCCPEDVRAHPRLAVYHEHHGSLEARDSPSRAPNFILSADGGRGRIG